LKIEFTNGGNSDQLKYILMKIRACLGFDFEGKREYL